MQMHRIPESRGVALTGTVLESKTSIISFIKIPGATAAAFSCRMS